MESVQDEIHRSSMSIDYHDVEDQQTQSQLGEVEFWEDSDYENESDSSDWDDDEEYSDATIAEREVRELQAFITAMEKPNEQEFKTALSNTFDEVEAVVGTTVADEWEAGVPIDSFVSSMAAPDQHALNPIPDRGISTASRNLLNQVLVEEQPSYTLSNGLTYLKRLPDPYLRVQDELLKASNLPEVVQQYTAHLDSVLKNERLYSLPAAIAQNKALCKKEGWTGDCQADYETLVKECDERAVKIGGLPKDWDGFGKNHEGNPVKARFVTWAGYSTKECRIRDLSTHTMYGVYLALLFDAIDLLGDTASIHDKYGFGTPQSTANLREKPSSKDSLGNPPIKPELLALSREFMVRLIKMRYVYNPAGEMDFYADHNKQFYKDTIHPALSELISASLPVRFASPMPLHDNLPTSPSKQRFLHQATLHYTPAGTSCVRFLPHWSYAINSKNREGGSHIKCIRGTSLICYRMEDIVNFAGLQSPCHFHRLFFACGLRVGADSAREPAVYIAINILVAEEMYRGVPLDHDRDAWPAEVAQLVNRYVPLYDKLAQLDPTMSQNLSMLVKTKFIIYMNQRASTAQSRPLLDATGAQIYNKEGFPVWTNGHILQVANTAQSRPLLDNTGAQIYNKEGFPVWTNGYILQVANTGHSKAQSRPLLDATGAQIYNKEGFPVWTNGYILRCSHSIRRPIAFSILILYMSSVLAAADRPLSIPDIYSQLASMDLITHQECENIRAAILDGDGTYEGWQMRPADNQSVSPSLAGAEVFTTNARKDAWYTKEYILSSRRQFFERSFGSGTQCSIPGCGPIVGFRTSVENDWYCHMHGIQMRNDSPISTRPTCFVCHQTIRDRGDRSLDPQSTRHVCKACHAKSPTKCSVDGCGPITGARRRDSTQTRWLCGRHSEQARREREKRQQD